MGPLTIEEVRDVLLRLALYAGKEEQAAKEANGPDTKYFLISLQDGHGPNVGINHEWLTNAVQAIDGRRIA